MEPIIKSLADTDLYKLTMMQAVIHQHPEAIVKYKFKCRNKDQSCIPPQDPSTTISPAKHKKEYLDRIDYEISNLCRLRFERHELKYLSKFPYIKPDFLDYLRHFQLNKNNISVSISSEDILEIDITGSWVSTILFEVPVLAIVSEVYNNFIDDKDYVGNNKSHLEGMERLYGKCVYIKGQPHNLDDFKFCDMGTRRRYSFKWQEKVIDTFIDELQPMFIGTSNVYFAMKKNISCVGTMAHEWLQAHQQLGVCLRDFQKDALEHWVTEYRGHLGIALSDCVGFDAFLKDFDLYYSKLFDGARHDSGDPFTWGTKLIEHYNKLNIDPKTKTAIFSDGLDFEKAIILYRHFSEHIQTSFGIGTYLTNDTGTEARQIVIKMVECNGYPVAKISDSEGKLMCTDNEFVDHIKKTFKNRVI